MLLKHILNTIKQTRRYVVDRGLKCSDILNSCRPHQQSHFIRNPAIIINIIRGCSLTLLRRTKFENNFNHQINKMPQSFENSVFNPKRTVNTASAIFERQMNFQAVDSSIKSNIKRAVHKSDQQLQQQYCAIDDEYDNQTKCPNYENAILALNALQSNAETLRLSIINNKSERQSSNALIDTEKYLVRSGLTIDDLKQLSYIHVSGTKGKGSTCALTESIIRSYGYKTGFFSSPHLTSVTERIRINGVPISKDKFSTSFWTVYKRMEKEKDYADDMPNYFKFLTILSFHVFLQENVDVAIMEVGIGGELDTTNIIPNTKTVGITSLGLEHTQLLGKTIEEIAWQKSGIIKSKSHVFTSVKRPECLKVIEKRAKEKQAIVYRVPELSLYFPDGVTEMQQHHFNPIIDLNASLAIQLSYDWLRQNNKKPYLASYTENQPILTEQVLNGLREFHWPGRCQIVKFQNFNMHLDGAHTTESMLICSKWFAQVTQNTVEYEKPRILLFNTTGHRDSQSLLQILHNFNEFQLVCFTPNIIVNTANSTDGHSMLYTQEEQLKRAKIHLENWKNLCLETEQPNNSLVFQSLLECFEYIHQKFANTMELNILVTGSIHLLGATILSLDQFAKRVEKVSVAADF